MECTGSFQDLNLYIIRLIKRKSYSHLSKTPWTAIMAFALAASLSAMVTVRTSELTRRLDYNDSTID